MVVQAWRTARTVRRMGPVTIDSLGPYIERLAREMSSQFAHQLVAFVVVVIGMVFQSIA